MKLRVLILTVMMLGSVTCATAEASEIIASTLGPNDSYGLYPTPIQHFPEGLRLEHAVRFQPAGGDYWLDAIRLPLTLQTDWPLTIDLHIAEDAGGVPGTTIASLFYGGALPVDVPFEDETRPPTEISWPSGQVQLQDATPYWLFITATPGNRYDVYWYLNDLGLQGNYAVRGTGIVTGPDVWSPSNLFTTPAFEILGSRVVPEPASLLSAMIAAIVLSNCRRRG